MARFEVLVRPVVFPNIRPAPARSLPPEDDPTQGFAVINGNGAIIMNNSFSWTQTISQNKNTETQRRVDVARVYQEDDQGNVNQDNFVDIDVANKIWSKGGSMPIQNVRGSIAEETITNIYQRVEETDNIEILKRDIIRKNKDI